VGGGGRGRRRKEEEEEEKRWKRTFKPSGLGVEFKTIIVGALILKSNLRYNSYTMLPKLLNNDLGIITYE
jgi:hypothetical protein